MNRRDFLRSGALLAAAVPLRHLAAAGGDATLFGYAWLKGQARALAGRPYVPPDLRLPAPLRELDYDRYQTIRHRPARSLWFDDGLHFRAQFFHRGFRQRERVAVYEVINGVAREVSYSPALFDFSDSGVDPAQLPGDLGFAGLRLVFHTNWKGEVVAFLGASYFRALGADNRQYGLSARGLAIGAGDDGGEEFPRFTAFWLERPARGASTITVYALLDSPSVAGAYRFEIAPGATLTMRTDAALYPRRAIPRLGLAPLTSMFLYGENERRTAPDWRPEIHDSDGLSIRTGAGEWLWRPLVNPPDIRLNSFLDDNPRGYGLLQRDRVFDHYQDDAVYYEHRPAAWVEIEDGWGKGAVQLMEMPAQDETVDNVVVWWHPAKIPQPGEELLLRYRLHWGARPPFAPSSAQVLATRTGLGGVVGRRRTHFSWRFVVDFVGGDLPALPPSLEPEPVVTASRGRIELASARFQRELGGFRVMFDLAPADGSKEPIDLRLFLRWHEQALTETWVYQWSPPEEWLSGWRESG